MPFKTCPACCKGVRAVDDKCWNCGLEFEMPVERTCPHCAETIKADAVKCKHCGSEVPPPPVVAKAGDAKPEKKKASCLELLGCVGALFVVGLFVAIFRGGDTDSNISAGLDEKAVANAEPKGQTVTKRGTQEVRPAGRERPIRQPDLRTDAVELAAAFQANEVAAQRRFGGKLLEVQGRVSAIELDLFENPIVSFETGMPAVVTQAQFPKNESTATSQLSIGSDITFWCADITEVLGNPQLSDCSFLLPSFSQ